MTNKVKKSADAIVKKYLMGNYTRSEAHQALTELNSCCFTMCLYDLATFDLGETQEYIHNLQDKYTCEKV